MSMIKSCLVHYSPLSADESSEREKLEILSKP